MKILRCGCGRPATHQVRIRLVPIAETVNSLFVPDEVGKVEIDYFSFQHLPTLAFMERAARRFGLTVLDYEITELWSASGSR